MRCEFTKKLHSEYRKAADAAGWQVVSETSFRLVWKLLFLNLFVSHSQSDVCCTCHESNARYIR